MQPDALARLDATIDRAPLREVARFGDDVIYRVDTPSSSR
jgi:hypothetical protein